MDVMQTLLLREGVRWLGRGSATGRLVRVLTALLGTVPVPLEVSLFARRFICPRREPVE
jgi:hypothetical protein